MGLIDALKNGRYDYSGGKAKNVKIELGEGDANITVRGDNVNIKAGTGTQNIVVLGNDVDIELDKNAAGNWDFDEDFDNVMVSSDDGKKGNVKIDTGDGHDLAYAVAKDVDIKMGKGDHIISYWADNKASINVGDGDNDIVTMDKFIQQGDLDEYTEHLGVNYGKEVEKALETSIVKSEEKVQNTTKTKNIDNFLAEMKEKYNLDEPNLKALELLYRSGYLNSNKYQVGIMQSVDQKNADGSPKYVVCRIDNYDEKTGFVLATGLRERNEKDLVSPGSNIFEYNIPCDGKYYVFDDPIKAKTSEIISYTNYDKEVYTETTADVYELNGAETVNIKTGNGSNYIDITSAGDVTINGKKSEFGHDINVDAVKVYDNEKTKQEEKLSNAKTVKIFTNTGKTYL